MTATVFNTSDTAGTSPLPGLRQTADQFPFTYTYYGFGANQQEDVLYASQTAPIHNNNPVRETCNETA